MFKLFSEPTFKIALFQVVWFSGLFDASLV